MSTLATGGTDHTHDRVTDAIAPGRPIRVLIADDHDLFRVGMASVLSEREDVEVVAQASLGRLAVRLAAELRPDVVLIDLRLPDLDGPAVTKAILEKDGSARVVALAAIVDESDVAAVINAGASGFLLKDSATNDVVSAIRAVASGAAWLSPRAAQAVLDRLRREHDNHGGVNPPGIDASLSTRELEVLRLLARGLDNNQIAAALSISPRTAKNHVSRILSKLGVHNRIQAAIYAVKRGLA
jgi:DNA-binding NarL/FixJ family response regulator